LPFHLNLLLNLTEKLKLSFTTRPLDLTKMNGLYLFQFIAELATKKYKS
jgi:hypothetical protein